MIEYDLERDHEYPFQRFHQLPPRLIFRYVICVAEIVSLNKLKINE